MDGAQVKLNFTLGTVPLQNRLFFVSRQPPVTHAQLVDLGIGVRAWHTDQVLPLLSSDLVGNGIIVEDWTTVPPPDSARGSFTASGGNGSGSHSANVSLLVRFKSASVPPAIYNWHHIGGIPRDAVATNTIDTGFQDAIFDAYVNLIDLAVGFGPSPAWRWVCCSSQDAGSYRTEQLALRTDFIQFPSRYVSPFRQRLKSLRLTP